VGDALILAECLFSMSSIVGCFFSMTLLAGDHDEVLRGGDGAGAALHGSGLLPQHRTAGPSTRSLFSSTSAVLNVKPLAGISRMCSIIQAEHKRLEGPVARRQPDGSFKSVSTGQRLVIHPSSVLFQSPPEMIFFNELVKIGPDRPCSLCHPSHVEPSILEMNAIM
jgi:hypothetical protein